MHLSWNNREARFATTIEDERLDTTMEEETSKALSRTF
jgi:hypothetical protein